MPAAPNHPLRAITAVVTAMVLLSVQDMTVKWMSDSYPLHQVMLVRASVATLIILLIMRVEIGWRGLRTSRPGAHLARSLLTVLANSTYFLGVAVMPLAEAMAVFFVAPLLITALSALLLRDPVGPRRWTAVAIGLTGVIMILRPGAEAVSLVALLPLAGACAYAAMQIITRRLGTTDPASTMAFYIQMTFIAVSTTMYLIAGDGALAHGADPALQFLLREWITPTPRDGAIMVAVGVVNGAVSYLLSQAYRSAEPSLVAPFEYTALPLAVGLGFLVFGDIPDTQASLGIVLIIGSGLYAMYRETVRRRQRAEKQSG
ncbi:MAG: EamA family transporter [Gammaproteobacteria bacterium]|nr:EamA family transporter [Gammaproteobacteria bacterium]